MRQSSKAKIPFLLIQDMALVDAQEGPVTMAMILEGTKGWIASVMCHRSRKKPSVGPSQQVHPNQPTEEGLLYIKIEKAASSTLASVAARSAIAIAERTHANTTREDGTEVPRICRFRGMGHLVS